MNKIFLFLSILILFSGCTAVEEAVNNTVSNITLGIISEINGTMSNISNQVAQDLSQGINDSINQFVSGIFGSEEFSFSSPVSKFLGTDISYLGIECEGNDSEIAGCINNWQIINIDYDASKPDSSYSIRWNYAFPGIYPSKEIIMEKVENGRIYGLCFDFAIIYCSIAEYYGLECRIMNSITKPSDKNPELLEYATGLGMEEYNDLIVKLKEKGMDYPYELIRQVMKETPEHYWAEVKIGNEWVIYDATNVLVEGSNTKENYIDTNDYELSVWQNNNTIELLESYSPKVDDLGENGKSWTIDDYFGSKMSGTVIPVPYYSSCNDVCAFFLGKNPACSASCIMDNSYFNCYESCSSEKFYRICDYICEDNGYEECYMECSGKELNIECFESC
ncbi:MAG: transglutaminase domain-containing protein [Patescibacteria group bacterium]|nr:transglutaminase domain-containing protein [Patescibacteria group bacterium]